MSNIKQFNFSNLSTQEIQNILNQYKIALTPQEAVKIQNEILQREPTLAELILWGIQGSEHCSYKSSRPFLSGLPTKASNVMVGVGQDAGIVEVARDKTGKKYGAVISHESHNSPSQVVPLEGAATGIGGNVRDVNCMGAKVIGVADSLRFGNITKNKSKWIHHGVVEGIESYANPIGVPNIGGDLYYDDSFDGACLVNVVTLGVVAEDEIISSHAPDCADGYDLILIGKPTDNSGFGGASFSSKEVDEDKKESNKGAVQEPNAFLKRHLLKANYKLFELLKNYNGQNILSKIAFKDLGAGGVACASVEIADGNDFGAEVYLEKVHTGMENLDPSVILCSETQERFMWCVPSELSEFICNHYNQTFDLENVSKGAKASIVGKITKNGQYTVFYKGEKLINAKAKDITKGIVYNRPYTNPNRQYTEPDIKVENNQITHGNTTLTFEEALLKILSHENVASRECVHENFDKTVQGIHVIRPGQADASVFQPFKYDNYPAEIRQTGLVLKSDNNPFFGKINPYLGAVNAVVECARNISAVGGYPQALTDCLNFGNPEKPEQMWEFVEAINGIKEACNNYKLKGTDEPLPIVAGNVSLYKESKGKSIAPSPVVAIIGNMPNAKNTITMSFKKPESSLILIGKRKDECGGSVYYSLFGELGKNVPNPNILEAQQQNIAVADMINQGLINSCHDISEGGLATTLAEMSFGNEIGCKVEYIDTELTEDKILFSQTGGFIIEVENNNLEKVQNELKQRNINYHKIGQTTTQKSIIINKSINLDLQIAKQAWTESLREKINN